MTGPSKVLPPVTSTQYSTADAARALARPQKQPARQPVVEDLAAAARAKAAHAAAENYGGQQLPTARTTGVRTFGELCEHVDRYQDRLKRSVAGEDPDGPEPQTLEAIDLSTLGT